MSDSLRGIRRAVPNDSSAWLADTAVEVRGYLAILDDAGWTQSRIAVEMGCSERSIQDWSKGVTDMSASKYRRLRALAAGVLENRRSA